ncbi:ArsC family reductase [Amphritea sp. HPY]|uniref:ArsC family reductase n=1 Tax=Amphritea sp. HPY TaxID=3421652 RepID=UPI003D7E7C01
MTTLYGIPNCDTVKKAQRWLQANGIEFSFHDFRKDGLEQQQLEQWAATLGWETLLNKRSTSWRQLDDEIKNNIDEQSAIREMLISPTLIKRPLLELNGQYQVGFKEANYASLF